MKTYPSGDNPITTVEDAAAIYGSLGFSLIDGIFLKDKWKLSELIRNGLSYNLFEHIRGRSPFSFTDWAEFLNISYKSMLRYKQTKESFKPLQSEKILEIAEVTAFGLQVFGDETKFKRWLDQPSFALGSVAPRTLLSDSYGKDLVMQSLTAIEYGVFA